MTNDTQFLQKQDFLGTYPHIYLCRQINTPKGKVGQRSGWVFLSPLVLPHTVEESLFSVKTSIKIDLHHKVFLVFFSRCCYS